MPTPLYRLKASLFCLFAIINLPRVASDEEFVVAAYLPEYRFYINTNHTAPHLTDLILFSLAPDNEGNLGPCCLEPHHFDQARQARAYKQQELPG